MNRYTFWLVDIATEIKKSTNGKCVDISSQGFVPFKFSQ